MPEASGIRSFVHYELRNGSGSEKLGVYCLDTRVLSKVPDSVDEIWVFGSSVTPYCRSDSDLDLCIIGHTTIEEESIMYKAAKGSVDIITETPEGFSSQSKIPGSVYKEVLDEGVLVYKKGADIKWQ